MPISKVKQALLAVGSATGSRQLSLLRKKPALQKEGKLMQFSTVAPGLEMSLPPMCVGQALLADVQFL